MKTKKRSNTNAAKLVRVEASIKELQKQQRRTTEENDSLQRLMRSAARLRGNAPSRR